VTRLFPDYREREKDYYRRTKIFPIMHLVVLRRDVYERHPFIASSLYNAFNEAKARAAEKMRMQGVLRYMLPWMLAEIEEMDTVFGGDAWPYGIEANRATLEAMVQYLADQALTPRRFRSRNCSPPCSGCAAKGERMWRPLLTGCNRESGDPYRPRMHLFTGGATCEGGVWVPAFAGIRKVAGARHG
jgi:hypothetical protein